MSLRINRSQPKGSWTDEQWNAIYTRGAHLLVAAAAGAGKTAVLVERIIQRILDPEDPCDVDRLLVVTFTDAAAAQMRERIGKALSVAAEDPHRPEVQRTRLRRQVALIDRASIQTLHGFCLWLLRRYFYLLEIDPMFRVLDGEEATLLRYEAVDRLLEEEYDKATAGDAFYALVDAYRDARSDASIRTIILELYGYAASLPDPETWYAEAQGMYEIPQDASIDDVPWSRVMVKGVAGELLAAEAQMRQALRLAEALGTPATVQEQLREEVALIADMAQSANSATWTTLYHLFAEPPPFKTLRFTGFKDDLGKARIQKARNKAKELVTQVAKEYFRHPPEVELDLLRESGRHVGELIRLVDRFGRLYRRSKRARGVVDFSDLERMALQILEHRSDDPEASSPSDELRPYFAEVLVDEYQDINPLQDAILRSVSRPATSDDPNLFMVGDVKQSIYRFRLADPTLFLHRMEHFQPFHEAAKEVEAEGSHDADKAGDSDGLVGRSSSTLQGVVIDLRANFRSREHVIDGVNFVFRQILTPGVGELAYDERAELVAKADYPPLDHGRVELHVVERDRERVPAGENDDSSTDDSHGEGADEETPEHRTALEREAIVVAELAKRILDGGELVFDRDQGGMRPARPSDIVVLLRSTKDRANVFVDAFRALGIPAYAELGTGFFWAVEVETMLSLLRVLDNPRQDIPLAAVLRAPWVDLSTTDLARIRAIHPKGDLYDAVVYGAERVGGVLQAKLQVFLEQLRTWRTAARLSPLGELLQRIYTETGYPEYVQGLPGGAQRLVNLNALHERAARFDGFTQGGLTRFLRFVDSLQAEDGDLGEAPVLGEGDDVVRIMSIHKSKGLQFPIVFVANLGKAFNISERSGSILYHGDLGIALQWSDSVLGLRTKTLAHQAVAEVRRREALAEELRVLYVALTRAQERLILVGAVPDIWATAARWSPSVDVQGWALPDFMLARARSHLDWIGPAVMRHADCAALRSAAEQESGTQLTVRDMAVHHDRSRWSVTLWGTDQTQGLGDTNRGGVAGPEAVDWERFAYGEPLGREVDPAVAQQLQESLGGVYPYAVSTVAPAKLSVTALARELYDEREGALLLADAAQGADQEALGGSDFSGGGGAPPSGEQPRGGGQEGDQQVGQTLGDGRQAGRTAYARVSTEVEPFTSPLRKPRFVEEEKVPNAAEHGTAMHTFLYHLDLKSPLTRAQLETNADELVARNLLSGAQRSTLDLDAVAHFFGSELGQRLHQAARGGLLWREWAFTVAVELDRLRDVVLAEAGPTGSSLDHVVVQGTVDALWMEKDRLYLIDYKTDRTGQASHLIARYRAQLLLYCDAVKQITQMPVGDAYLVHLRSQSQVIPLGS